jgi:hypothetical protein
MDNTQSVPVRQCIHYIKDRIDKYPEDRVILNNFIEIILQGVKHKNVSTWKKLQNVLFVYAKEVIAIESDFKYFDLLIDSCWGKIQYNILMSKDAEERDAIEKAWGLVSPIGIFYTKGLFVSDLEYDILDKLDWTFPMYAKFAKDVDSMYILDFSIDDIIPRRGSYFGIGVDYYLYNGIVKSYNVKTRYFTRTEYNKLINGKGVIPDNKIFVYSCTYMYGEHPKIPTIKKGGCLVM